MLTGWWFSLEPLYPFLKMGVIFAFFKMDVDVDFLMHSLKNLQISSVKISAFSWSTLIGVSVL